MPKRSTLRFEDWPVADQEAWSRATAPADVLDEGGLAAEWACSSRKLVRDGYARWLTYLLGHDGGVLDLPPPDRVTRELVRRYLTEACANLAPNTRCSYARSIYDVMRVIAPERDWTWLRAIVASLARHVLPQSKLHRIVDPLSLIALGQRLMETADSARTPPHYARENQYRDGLIIALVAFRPVRRGNLASIRIGRQLVRVGNGYKLVFEAHETKNRKPLEMPIPPDLFPYLQRYLAEVRPRFYRADQHDGLWASEKGFPMDPASIYDRVCLRTRAAFGRSVNLHSIRDSAATLLAETDADGLNNARDLLGHARLETTERHYIHARSRKAVLAYQQILRQRREASTKRG